MMTDQPKLELTWIGKKNRQRLEPRILIEDKALSYQADVPAPSQGDLLNHALLDNLLIQGDNLLALKALEAKYAGKVKCVFIDPPYNTGSAFTHYDDGVEHSMWLTLIRDRLEIIRNLLADDGSLWITIDDNEAHYLKVLCDEIFGRSNFVANVLWQKRIGPDNRLPLGAAHDHVLVFSKNKALFQSRANRVPLTSKQLAEFKNPDKDPRGLWTSSSNFSAQGYRPNQMYPIVTPGGAKHVPPAGRCWVTIEKEYFRLLSEGRMWFGSDGLGMPRKKTYLEEQEGRMSWTWWSNDEVGNTQESKKEGIALFGAKDVFDTPKPERLLSRILQIATNPGDLVLDSFAGSGTTGAVAHKMGRRWIMVELGEHCHTHIVPRLKKVIDGKDQGGISKAVDWQGGGGFRYFRLAPSLLKKDQWGNWVINPAYNAEMLAEAMCKHMGFEYSPSQAHFWEHGRSSESDFIYVTTGSLSHDQLRRISDDVGNERTLLICCKAFMADVDAFPNLTLNKIPQTILGKCEWDQDDYSFSINVTAELDSQGLQDE